MKPHLQQFVKFVIIGTGNTALDALIYTTLTRTSEWFAEEKLVAAFLAFVVSCAHGFYWNRRWTFRARGRGKWQVQMLKFYAANTGALFINQVAFWFLVQAIPDMLASAGASATIYNAGDVIAKVGASILAGGVNFAMQKAWAFAEHEIEEMAEHHQEELAEAAAKETVKEKSE